MLDYISTYPSPTGHNAADEIVNIIINYRTPVINISSIENYKKILHDISYKIVCKNPPLYSYAAWCTGGKEEYVNMVIDKIKSSKNKIKAIIKTLGFLYRIYRNSQERLYAPGGSFETEHSLIWNPILNDRY